MFQDIEKSPNNKDKKEEKKHVFSDNWWEDEDCDNDDDWDKEWDDFGWDTPQEDNDDEWEDCDDCKDEN